ncbi:zinc ribbon domain-containing protein [Mycolicibacterium aurum]|uniref:zinc ribbon domain-containing protein n=1 Tax=Mycolicibacterium aurum TaxID=1791 RepID=UPI0021F313AF|nr:zinc ribbon domain-containing protein [Mycolicibacterium aurum]
MSASSQPAVDGWFATDGSGDPYLIGGKCPQCGTYVFPPRSLRLMGGSPLMGLVIRI